jgi:hypothetical protein
MTPVRPFGPIISLGGARFGANADMSGLGRELPSPAVDPKAKYMVLSKRTLTFVLADVQHRSSKGAATTGSYLYGKERLPARRRYRCSNLASISARRWRLSFGQTSLGL